MTTMTMTRPAPATGPRVEQCLGVSFVVERTDQADEKLRYRARITAMAGEVAGLAVGDVLGWGREPRRARRRAVEKIANRRRGPVRSAYTVQGVTFAVGPNRDRQAPNAHAFLAQVTAVDQVSPARKFVSVGQVLARRANGANAADRAYLVLADLAERARLDVEQEQAAVTGAQLVVDEAVAAGRWDDDALCKQVDPDLFYPDGENATGYQAKAICARCTIRVECLAKALDRREPFGVWGGETESGRRKMLRAGITGDWLRAQAGLPVAGESSAA
jgi:hypothetical protein